MLGSRYAGDGIPLVRLSYLQRRMKSQIDKKVESGIYAFESVDCVVCGGNDFELLSEKDRYGLYCPCVICRSCGLVQTNPRMSQDSYNAFYDCEYRKLYGGRERPGSKFFGAQYENGARIFRMLSSLMDDELRDKHVVEVGVGAGGNLKYFKDKGNKVFGVDLGSEYVKYGVSQGLDLCVGSLDALRNRCGKVDVVLYCHVLEHLLDPVAEMRSLMEIMHEGTSLYVEVPGLGCLKNLYRMDFLRYLNNAHTYHFTLNSLSNVMRKVGLEFVWGSDRIDSVWRVARPGHTYVSDYTETKRFLKELEKKRKNEIYRIMASLREIGGRLLQLKGFRNCLRFYNRIRGR